MADLLIKDEDNLSTVLRDENGFTLIQFGSSVAVGGGAPGSGSGGSTTASTTEVLTGTDAAKSVTPAALAALWTQGTDVASAATVSLGEGGYFKITGTTTITDIDFATDKAGRVGWVQFSGALTLTHNASTLILPGGANITTAAGDVACFISEGSDVVRCAVYTKANGQAVVGGSGSSGFGAFVTLTDGATVTPNATSTNNFIWTIGGNRTLANPTGLADGQEIRIVIKQDATGSRIITWGSKYKFSGGAPALSTTANAYDVLICLYNSALDLLFCSLGKGFA